MPHKFDPAHLARLESDDRRAWNDPERAADLLALQPGHTCVDLGAGPGFFALPLAHRVGPSGRVYAADIEPAMLARLSERAQREGLSQVATVQSEESRVPLPDGLADAALMANVFHEFADRGASLREAARLLKPGGRLLIIDWKPVPMNMGPPLHDRLPAEQALADLAAAGLMGEETEPIGPYHWSVLARRV